jgi:hypothetical protein
MKCWFSSRNLSKSSFNDRLSFLDSETGPEKNRSSDDGVSIAAIAPSADECNLHDKGVEQIAKQTGNSVTLKRSWLSSHPSLRSRAGLILHELLVRARHSNSVDCTTNVRKMVGMIDRIDQYSENELRDQLASVIPGPPNLTRAEAKRFNDATAASLKKGCQSDTDMSVPVKTLLFPNVTVGTMHPDTIFSNATAISAIRLDQKYISTGQGGNMGEEQWPISEFEFGSESDCKRGIQILGDYTGLPGNSSEVALQSLLSASTENHLQTTDSEKKSTPPGASISAHNPAAARAE